MIIKPTYLCEFVFQKANSERTLPHTTAANYTQPKHGQQRARVHSSVKNQTSKENNINSLQDNATLMTRGAI